MILNLECKIGKRQKENIMFFEHFMDDVSCNLSVKQLSTLTTLDLLTCFNNGDTT